MSNDIGKYDHSEASLIRQASVRYETLYNLDNVYQAFNQVKKSSLYKPKMQSRYWYQLMTCQTISNQLRSGNYKPDDVSTFVINERGKRRIISANTIRDRIVNTLLANHVLTPLTEPLMIYDNGASRKGMGVKHSRCRLEKHLHDAAINFGSQAIICVFDLSNYFGSIHIPSLLDMYDNLISDKRIFTLLKNQIRAHNKGDIGIGIGSILSQNAGIFYPHKFDNFVKIVLSRKYYGRYMDDFYIICEDKRDASEICTLISEYLSKQLKLTVNSKKTQIATLAHGFKYLKFYYRVNDSGKIIKRQDNATFRRERRKLKRFKNTDMLLKDIENSYRSWRGSILCNRYNKPRLSVTDTIFKELYPSLSYEQEET